MKKLDKGKMKLFGAAVLTLVVTVSMTYKLDNDWKEDGLRGKVKSHTRFSYEVEYYFDDIKKGKRKYSEYDKDFQIKYDTNGNRIENNTYDSDGSLRRRYTYKYDTNGNKIGEKSFNSDGSLLAKNTNKYDTNENRVETTCYKPDGRLRSRFASKYDTNGNEIEWIMHIKSGSIDSKVTYKYDTNGNRIERISYEDGSLFAKTTYKYDTNGNKIENNRYIFDVNLDEKFTYKYNYDQIGNWTKRTEYKNGIAKTITERKIVYYP